MGKRIDPRLALGQEAIDDQELLREANRSQFPMGAHRFAQRRTLGARDENETCALTMRERAINAAIPLELPLGSTNDVDTLKVSECGVLICQRRKNGARRAKGERSDG